MYTSILLTKKSLKEQYKSKILLKYMTKKLYKKTLKNVFDNMLENHFIFKYDDLMELYKLLDINETKTNIEIVDDNYDYLTIILLEDNIISIRIDISVSEHTIYLTVEELSIGYTMKYDFKDKMRFSMYHQESKDKDQQLIALCNTILVKAYISELMTVYFTDTTVKLVDPNFVDVLDKYYNTKEEEVIKNDL